jgi:hypothetical protein
LLTKTEHKVSDTGGGKANQRREKFVKLAESRTANAIKAIRVIGKLANKSAYEFSDADVRKIVAALNREIDAMRTRMTSSGGKETIDFKL